MHSELGPTVQYQLPVGDELIPMNERIGQTLTLNFSGAIFCNHCGRKSKKSFNQGYCYPCFKRLAQCDSCIVSPEKCHFDAGTCREPDWAQEFCMTEHIVYLSNTSKVKVGITRGNQVPTRWIDQGASQALPILAVGTRHLSGLVEVLFKEHVADKTNWRAMLKGPAEALDMTELASSLLEKVSSGIEALQSQAGLQAVQVLEAQTPVAIEYPVLQYPEKVTSLNAEKTPEISGTLQGIKGQYLIFDIGVINMRKYGGYEVTVS